MVMTAMVVAALLTAPDKARACDALSIPSLNSDWCVVKGGQSEIDSGQAVRYEILSSDWVHWVAGHRSTHGGTFGALTSLSIGDEVVYRDITYVIRDYRLVNRDDTVLLDEWRLATSPTLVLQTSASSSVVHVWHALPAVEQHAVALPVPQPTPPTEAKEMVTAHVAALLGTGSSEARVGGQLDQVKRLMSVLG